MSHWTISFDDRDPLPPGVRDSICALGNGYVVTRGTGAERSTGSTGTYLAGGYDRFLVELDGRTTECEELVNWPDWLVLSFRPADGDWLDSEGWTMLEQRHTLDMQRGMLVRRMRVRDSAGRVTSMRSRRLVHMGNPHLAAIEWEFTPENWSGAAVVRTAIDATVTNPAPGEAPATFVRHLVPLLTERGGDGVVSVLVETAQSHLRMAQAARTLVFADGRELRVERQPVESDGFVGEDLHFRVSPGRAWRVEKTVAFFTSRDHATSEPLAEAGDLARRAPQFPELLRTHALAWKRLWHRCDIAVDLGPPEPDAPHDDPEAAAGSMFSLPPQAALRLRIFHLLQTVSPHAAELDAGVPSHGWHGQRRRGHVGWDELFVLPLLDLRLPEAARALLMYRVRRLDAARLIAAAEGQRGARFPWRSGSNGREEAPSVRLDPATGRWLPDRSGLRLHVNSAVARDVWHYHEATGDEEFLSFHGAEVVLEIARYWAGRATFHDADARYHIRGVRGPEDAGAPEPAPHAPEGVDDDAYTNVMAAWVLLEAGDLLLHLADDRRAELLDQLEITDAELARWREIGALLAVPFHDGVIGAAGDAGVLMLLHVFSPAELRELLRRMGYDVSEESLARTVSHHLERERPRSTLAVLVHARVLARMDPDRSWSLLREALAPNLRDATDDDALVHMGAMAAALDVVQGGYLGVTLREDVLWIEPRLPAALSAVRATLRYRGRWLDVHATAHELKVTARDDSLPHPARVGVAGRVRELRSGETVGASTEAGHAADGAPAAGDALAAPPAP